MVNEGMRNAVECVGTCASVSNGHGVSSILFANREMRRRAGGRKGGKEATNTAAVELINLVRP